MALFPDDKIELVILPSKKDQTHCAPISFLFSGGILAVK